MTGPTSASRIAASDSFRDILVVCALDESGEQSLTIGAEIARAHGARLTALAVRDCAAEIDRFARYSGRDRSEIEALQVAEDRERLEAMAARCIGDVELETQIRIGQPFREIIADVIANDRDLVVKVADPFDARHRQLFASTDQHLIRKCPCPVWIAMAPTRRPSRAVLAAIDLDDGADGAQETEPSLNGAILTTALRIAQREGAELHVTHVWQAPAEDLVRRWGTSAEEAHSYVEEVRARRRRLLDRLVDGLREQTGATAAPVRIVAHLAHGQPREVIPAHVRTMGIDLLVIGTIARTGIPGLIIGNTAEDVLNTVECSVVTVKPPGYVSPLDTSATTGR